MYLVINFINTNMSEEHLNDLNYILDLITYDDLDADEKIEALYDYLKDKLKN